MARSLWWLLLLGVLSAPVWCEDEGDEGDEGEGEGSGADDEEEGSQDSLTPEQMRGLHSKFDADKDGKVTLMEVIQHARQMQLVIAKKDVITIMEGMDTNKDSKLSLEELLKDLDSADTADEEERKEMKISKEFETAKFKAADKNGDGQLDAEELPALFYPETSDPVLEISAKATLREKDKDGDGKLSAKEFAMPEEEGGEDEEEIMSSPKMLPQAEEFGKLDKDGDGHLSLSELKVWEAGAFHTEEALNNMIDIADKDGDKQVTAEELENARHDIAGSDAQYHLLEWAEHHEL